MKTLYDKSGNKVYLNDYENLISDDLQVIFPGRIGYEFFSGIIYLGGLDSGVFNFHINDVSISLDDVEIPYSDLRNCILILQNGFLAIQGSHSNGYSIWRTCNIIANLKITKR